MSHIRTFDLSTILFNADASVCFELYQDLGSPHDVSHHPVRMMTTDDFGEGVFIDYSMPPSGAGEIRKMYEARERGVVDHKDNKKNN